MIGSARSTLFFRSVFLFCFHASLACVVVGRQPTVRLVNAFEIRLRVENFQGVPLSMSNYLSHNGTQLRNEFRSIGNHPLVPGLGVERRVSFRYRSIPRLLVFFGEFLWMTCSQMQVDLII
jgi:hypothetical protein